MSVSSRNGGYSATFATPYQKPSHSSFADVLVNPLSTVASSISLKSPWHLAKIAPIIPELPYLYNEKHTYYPRFKTKKFTSSLDQSFQNDPASSTTSVSYAKIFYSRFYHKKSNSRTLNSIILYKKIDPTSKATFQLVEDKLHALEFGTKGPPSSLQLIKQTATLVNDLRLLNLENTVEHNYGIQSEPYLMLQDPEITDEIWSDLTFLRTTLESVLETLLCESDIQTDSVETLYEH
ncbi:hypothetical protein OGAPHI_005284 [Ogataea philodendri]|uniref:Uncharacterized protein n=1 Tax=Ogataea philodendri TaxID=1378263 RepID=A0A9P8P2M9_9ASCO|nr:uncharacterized protein OGAPHI_005284 [Ogataea philodendri]KAH3663881.1 hypothetical protein OGAPHI_005284 [Ogataea philodendri]